MKLVLDNGKEIELSQETSKKLQKELSLSRKLEVGSKVYLKDNSAIFGVHRGEYSQYAGGGINSKKVFTVLALGLKTIRDWQDIHWEYTKELKICGALITDGDNGYWFVNEKYLETIK